MPSLVDELLQEHREIRTVLKLLSSQLDSMEPERDPDWTLIREAMDYLTRYPDLFHHGCEEVIFRHLHRHDPESREFVADLGREHSLLRELGMHFLALCEDAAQDRITSRTALESAGRRYLVAQERHMRKEEQTVFPRVRKALPADVWGDIREDLQHMPGWRLDRGGTLRQFDTLRSYLDR
ncbi:MAG: hemerythrin domain-containing protein [Ectothiorhodospiraceae bacterium]|nr:hemerythrin domain-containing protein [Ectothiorhodospiraceae bacterium]